MELVRTKLGILQDIADNKVDLDHIGEWMREQLIEMILHEPQLIDVDGPSVFLTNAGRASLNIHQRDE